MSLSKKQAKEVPVIKARQLTSIELKKLFQPRGSTAARLLLDRWLSVEVYEKQIFSSILTLIRDYVFELYFFTTLDI